MITLQPTDLTSHRGIHETVQPVSEESSTWAT
jgi:hypothetical protein